MAVRVASVTNSGPAGPRPMTTNRSANVGRVAGYDRLGVVLARGRNGGEAQRAVLATERLAHRLIGLRRLRGGERDLGGESVPQAGLQIGGQRVVGLPPALGELLALGAVGIGHSES